MLHRNFWVLLGTASTWFLLDIAFYSQNLFLPNILEGIGYSPAISLPASKCVKTHTCPKYNLPVRSNTSQMPLFLPVWHFYFPSLEGTLWFLHVLATSGGSA